jgi:hypothetical protein
VTLAGFFESGAAVDLVLAMVIAEGVLLALAGRAGGRLSAFRGLGWSLVSAGCLVLALRASLAGGNWTWMAAGLSGSLVAHLMDLRQRWLASRA